MKLKLMGEDLAKFQGAEGLAIEDVLGILQNVGKDIKKETGLSIEDCTIRDPDVLMNLLIWMGLLYSRIYERNSDRLNSARRLEEYKSRSAQLQERISAVEPAEQEIQKLKGQFDSLETTYAASTKTKQELESAIRQLQTALQADQQREDELTAKKQQLDMQNAAQKNRISVLELDIQALEAADIPTGRKKNVALELQKNRLLDEKGKMQEELDQVEKEIQELQKEQIQLERRIKDKSDEVEDRQEKLKVAYGTHAHLSEKEKSLEAEIDALELKMAGKSEEVLSKTLEAKRNKLEANLSKCEALEADIEAQQSALEKKEKEVTVKEETLKAIRLKTDEVDAELAEYERKQKDIEQSREKLLEKENRLKMFKQIHATLNLHMSKLAGLSDMDGYTDEAGVDRLLNEVDHILQNVHQAIKLYVTTTNNRVEEIK